MLIDDVVIQVKAGHGGRGNVSFDTSKLGQGPSGGNGGKGGSIFVEGVTDLTALKRFRFQKRFEAKDGEAGRRNKQTGADAADLVLKVPIGTVVHNLTQQSSQEVLKVGEQLMVAKGGNGGWGNNYFKSSRNTSPTQFQPGLPGEEFELRLELRLIADIGLIGLPNAGKSSLLNSFTRAKAKVANYPFTTLEPNLGVFTTYKGPVVVADIPGLIEGAAKGKGLGVKFLQHVQRTRHLLHCLSAESDDVERDYHIVRSELKAHDPELMAKPEAILFTKVDLLTKEQIEQRLTQLRSLNPLVIPVSVVEKDGNSDLLKFLNSLVF